MEFNMDKRLLLILPILSGVCWGTGGVFVRIFNAIGFNSVSILSTRVFVGTLMLFIILMLFNREALKIKLKDLWLFAGSGLLGTLMLNLCYNEANFTSSLSLAALLLSLAPIFALVFSAILFKEKITPKKVLCLIIALFGCVLVSGFLESSGFKWSTYGVMFGLGSALFWAAYGVFSKLASNKGYSTFTIIFYSFLFISIVLAPFTQWGLFATFLTSNPIDNSVLAIAHSVLSCVLPYFLFSAALSKIENGLASIINSGAEPISATIFGALLFAEIPSVLNIIGIIITLVALSLLIKAGQETE